MIDSIRQFMIRPRVASALAGFILAALVSAAAPTLVHAVRSEIVGSARVLDGDTIKIAGRHIRLEGIDAPEVSQRCGSGALGRWRCGAEATNALVRLIGGREVSCQSRGEDRYGRMLGLCFAGGRELNAEMVRSGQAWAFVKYSTSYVAEEQQARAARIGIWRADTEPAWAYRAKRWSSAEQAAPEGCAIKGNITGNGQIYHMPWGTWYDKVRIEPAKGERWFCSEAEAAAAGWRPAASY